MSVGIDLRESGPTEIDRLIVYNGATGGIGRHVHAAASRAGSVVRSVNARLNDRAGLAEELEKMPAANAISFIHLAAIVSVPKCESDPDLAFATNVEGAVSTAEEVARWAIGRGSRFRIVLASSGHVYAAPTEGTRVTESSPVEPRSTYARTKLAAERRIAVLAAQLNIELVVARIFGLIAPAQPGHYVLPGLIDRVVQNRLEEIPGLDNVRDYLDARDVSDALVALASCSLPDTGAVVNVCSGNPVSVRHLLRAILETVDPGGGEARLRAATSAPGRADDLSWLVGDPSLLRRLAGRSFATIPLEVTVADAISSTVRGGAR